MNVVPASERFNLRASENLIRYIPETGPGKIPETELWIPRGISANNQRVKNMRSTIARARLNYSAAKGRNAKLATVRNFHKKYTNWHDDINKSLHAKRTNLETFKLLMRSGNKAGLNAFIKALNNGTANLKAKSNIRAIENAKAKANLAAKKLKAKANLEKLRVVKANLENKRNALESQINEIMNKMRPLLNLANN